MSQGALSVVHMVGTGGLYTTIVGAAVILLMPDKAGYAFGKHLAIFGCIAMAYELALASPL